MLFIILAIVLIVTLVVAKKSERKYSAGESYNQMFKDSRESVERIEREEREKRQKQREEHLALENKFASSSLTREIIRAISDGTGRKPEEILIYNDRVSGITNGVTRTFAFATNRVEKFKSAIKFQSDEMIDERDIVRPQVALAAAINRIMGNEYDAIDRAKRTAERKSFSDGDTYVQYGYMDEHVDMVLKPTKEF